MKDLIEKLKKNEKPFGLLTLEEQECLDKVGKQNCLVYTNSGKWENAAKCSFQSGNTYAIKPDYQPEPEFVDLEIVRHGDFLGAFNDPDVLPFNFTHLHCLPSLPKFHSFVYTKVNGVEEWLPTVSVASEIDEGHKVFARFRS